ITVCNRGAEAAGLHLLPTLWFRNMWCWWPEQAKPSLTAKENAGSGCHVLVASHGELGQYYFYCEGAPALLFTENETNNQRLYGSPNPTPYVKDGINDCVVSGKSDAVNPARTGTKAAAHYRLSVGGGKTAVIRLRLAQQGPVALGSVFGPAFAEIMEARRR